LANPGKYLTKTYQWLAFIKTVLFVGFKAATWFEVFTRIACEGQAQAQQENTQQASLHLLHSASRERRRRMKCEELGVGGEFIYAFGCKGLQVNVCFKKGADDFLDFAGEDG
jgi:hypothetical protein